MERLSMNLTLSNQSSTLGLIANSDLKYVHKTKLVSLQADR